MNQFDVGNQFFLLVLVWRYKPFVFHSHSILLPFEGNRKVYFFLLFLFFVFLVYIAWCQFFLLYPTFFDNCCDSLWFFPFLVFIFLLPLYYFLFLRILFNKFIFSCFLLIYLFCFYSCFYFCFEGVSVWEELKWAHGSYAIFCLKPWWFIVWRQQPSIIPLLRFFLLLEPESLKVLKFLHPD